MDINPDARARIAAAADQLFEQSGRAAFPTVDAVRRLSKTNMNDASAAMKDWRRGQAAVAPAAIAVPGRVQQSFQAALAALWAEAQETANEALRASQAVFEAEREEAEALRGEMSAAFEAQAAELEALQARLAETEANARTAAAELEAVRGKLAGAESRAATAEARAVEIEKRADDIKTALAAAQAQQAALLATLQETRGLSDEARKKALVGASILAKVERGEWPGDKMLAMMDAALADGDDRALFGLAEAKQAKPRTAKPRNLDIENR